MDRKYPIFGFVGIIVILVSFNLFVVSHLHKGCEIWNCTFIGLTDYGDCYSILGYRNNKSLNCPPCQIIDWKPVNGTCYTEYENNDNCPFRNSCFNGTVFYWSIFCNTILGFLVIVIIIHLLNAKVEKVERPEEYETL